MKSLGLRPDYAAGLAARTVSGNPPPTAFLITLWALTVILLGGVVAALLGAYRLRQKTRDMPEGQQRSGKRGQAGCLLIAAIPATLFGLFLLTWAIGIS
ncbi:hypothetical protein [Leekyejoonella antrihumi]|uniref:Uncharacterized protein n=1 Tax=Leekyejoonella antrihumi TaxID=1660198 RepID=A0A563E9P8_9MICO|nr:hypothetical protein [Leekyejoonella antrihumi]TWP38982.1 hypothetical protein FGL98_00880 [Leekyejoonella antrihumi]